LEIHSPFDSTKVSAHTVHTALPVLYSSSSQARQLGISVEQAVHEWSSLLNQLLAGHKSLEIHLLVSK